MNKPEAYKSWAELRDMMADLVSTSILYSQQKKRILKEPMNKSISCHKLYFQIKWFSSLYEVYTLKMIYVNQKKCSYA